MSDDKETVILSGVLTKKGGVTAAHWKPRYFVLTPNTLLYYRGPPNSAGKMEKLKLRVPLADATLARLEEGRAGGYRNAFAMQPKDGKALVLVARDPDELERWFVALHQAIEEASKVSSAHWSESTSCHGCQKYFTIIRRRHHCRNCGYSFCDSCSSKSWRPDESGRAWGDSVRVCDGCATKLGGRGPARSLVVETLQEGLGLGQGQGQETDYGAEAAAVQERFKEAVIARSTDSAEEESPVAPDIFAAPVSQAVQVVRTPAFRDSGEQTGGVLSSSPVGSVSSTSASGNGSGGTEGVAGSYAMTSSRDSSERYSTAPAQAQTQGSDAYTYYAGGKAAARSSQGPPSAEAIVVPRYQLPPPRTFFCCLVY